MNITAITGLTPLESKFSLEKENEAKEQKTASFKDIMNDAVMRLQSHVDESDNDASGLIAGDISDLHTVMINQATEALAVETAVQLTSRAVSAYKEVMQMQI